MKIAITDACIFIDILELQLAPAFFNLELEVHTSVDVFNELFSSQRDMLKVFQRIKKLVLHNIEEEDRIFIDQMMLPRSLSTSDKTVLFLAKKLDAMIISSDKAVRYNAKLRKIEYHGMLWIFDCLLEASLISYEEATDKLKKLVMANIIYRNNVELVNEMNNRLKRWHKNFVFDKQ